MQAIEYIKKSAQEVHERQERLGGELDDERCVLRLHQPMMFLHGPLSEAATMLVFVCYEALAGQQNVVFATSQRVGQGLVPDPVWSTPHHVAMLFGHPHQVWCMELQGSRWRSLAPASKRLVSIVSAMFTDWRDDSDPGR